MTKADFDTRSGIITMTLLDHIVYKPLEMDYGKNMEKLTGADLRRTVSVDKV